MERNREFLPAELLELVAFLEEEKPNFSFVQTPEGYDAQELMSDIDNSLKMSGSQTRRIDIDEERFGSASSDSADLDVLEEVFADSLNVNAENQVLFVYGSSGKMRKRVISSFNRGRRSNPAKYGLDKMHVVFFGGNIDKLGREHDVDEYAKALDAGGRQFAIPNRKKAEDDAMPRAANLLTPSSDVS